MIKFYKRNFELENYPIAMFIDNCLKISLDEVDWRSHAKKIMNMNIDDKKIFCVFLCDGKKCIIKLNWIIEGSESVDYFDFGNKTSYLMITELLKRKGNEWIRNEGRGVTTMTNLNLV